MHSYTNKSFISLESGKFLFYLFYLKINYQISISHKFLLQGEQLGTTEATEVFFAMTKLFQSKDVVLRRMVYLGIRELSSIAEDVIIVTSSLTKDMTGNEALYRAAAIRALCSITDVSQSLFYP